MSLALVGDLNGSRGCATQFERREANDLAGLDGDQFGGDAVECHLDAGQGGEDVGWGGGSVGLLRRTDAAADQADGLAGSHGEGHVDELQRLGRVYIRDGIEIDGGVLEGGDAGEQDGIGASGGVRQGFGEVDEAVRAGGDDTGAGGGAGGDGGGAGRVELDQDAGLRIGRGAEVGQRHKSGEGAGLGFAGDPDVSRGIEGHIEGVVGARAAD